jgi:predicted hotdog family 3-hydroxylacyl-ACP dehydratase
VLIGREELCRLIPHAGAMCLLDGVIRWNEESIECISGSHRDPGNPLRKQDRLAGVHAIEYGAQAIAVHGGLIAQAEGDKAEPAMLAALRDVTLSVSRLDQLPAPLQISAKCLIASGGNLLYAFTVTAGDSPVASGRATVIVPEPSSPC